MEPPEVLSPTEPWMSGMLPQTSAEPHIQPFVESTGANCPNAKKRSLSTVTSQDLDTASVREMHHLSTSEEAGVASLAMKLKNVNTNSQSAAQEAFQNLPTSPVAQKSALSYSEALLKGKNSPAKARDLGTASGALTQPPAGKSKTGGAIEQRSWPPPERSPLSKPSEAKASQEWRKQKGSKENRDAALPKYRSKGPQGLVVAPGGMGGARQDRSPLAAMDLAMSQQLHGDFYRLLGFSSPTEELRHAQQTLQERDREVAALRETAGELTQLKLERQAEKEQLEAAKRREASLKEECSRAAQALRKQIEEVALLRSDRAVFEQALADADDRAEESESRAEASETRAREVENRVKDAEDRAHVSGTRAKEAEDQAKASETRALEAENRANQAGVSESEAEGRAVASETRAFGAENRAKELETRVLEAENLAREMETWAKGADARAKEAESRAVVFETRALEAGNRATEAEARVAENREKESGIGQTGSELGTGKCRHCGADDNRVRGLQETIAANEKEIESARREARALQEEVLTCQTRIGELDEAVKGYQEGAVATEHEMEAAGREAQNLMKSLLTSLELEREEKAALEKELDAARTEIEGLSGEIEAVVANSEEMKESLEGVVAAVEEGGRLKRHVADLVAETQRLEQEAAEKQETGESLKQHVADLVAENERLELEAAEMEESRERLLQTTAEVSAESERIAADLGTVTEQLAVVSEKRNADVAGFVERLGEANQEKAALTQRVEVLEKGLEERDAQMEELRIAAVGRETRVDELAMTNADVSFHLGKASGRARALEEDLRASGGQLAAAEIVMQQSARRAEELAIELGLTKAQIAETESEIGRLGRVVQAALSGQFLADLNGTAVRGQIERLREDLAAETEALTRADGRIEELEILLEAEVEAVTRAEGEKADLARELAVQGEAQTRAEEKLEEAGNELVAHSAAGTSAEGMILELEERVDGLEGQLAVQTAAVIRGEESVAEMEGQLAAAATRAAEIVGELEGQLAARDAAATRAEETVAELEGQLAANTAASTRVKETLTELEGQLAVRRAAASDLEGQVELQTKKVHALKTQLEQEALAWKEKLAASRKQLRRLQKELDAAAKRESALKKTAQFALSEQFFAGLVATSAKECVAGLVVSMERDRNETEGLRKRIVEARAMEIEWESRVATGVNRVEELEDLVGALHLEARENGRLVWRAAGQLRAMEEETRGLIAAVARGQQAVVAAQEKSEAAQEVFTQRLDQAKAEGEKAVAAISAGKEALEKVANERGEELRSASRALKDAHALADQVEVQTNRERDLASKEVASLRTEIGRLGADLAGKEGAMTELASELEGARAALNTTEERSKGDVARLEADVARLESDVARLEGDVARLQVLVAAQEGDVTETESLRQQLMAEQTGHVAEIERLQTKMAVDLKRHVAEAERLREKLAAEQKGHVAEIERLQAELGVELKGHVAEIERLQEQLAAEQKGHVADIERLQARLAVEQELTEERGAEMQRQLQQAQIEKAEVLGKNELALMDTQSIVELEVRLIREELREAQAGAGAAFALAEEQRVECSLAVADKLALTDQLRSAMELTRNSEARYQELVAVTDLEARVAAAELDTCRRQIKEGVEREEALKAQIASREAQLAVLNGTVVVTEKELQLVRERCGAAEAALVACQTELSTAAAALTAATDETAALQQQMRDLREAHSALESATAEARRAADGDLEARAHELAVAEAQAESLREALGKLSQQRLAATEGTAALQAQLDEARADVTKSRADVSEARAQVSALEQALLVAHVTSLGLARAAVTSAVEAANVTWAGREAAVQEKHRREREAWEETAQRSEAEFAELREFSELETAVVAERSAELEATVQELQGHVAALEADLAGARDQHDDLGSQVTSLQAECAELSRAHVAAMAAAEMRLAGVLRASKDDLVASAESHQALVAELQSEVEQLSELQLATAATALSLGQEKEEVKRQLVEAEGQLADAQRQLAEMERQLAASKGTLSQTNDKEREMAAEVAACRAEIERLRQNIAAEAEASRDLSTASLEKDDVISELQVQIADVTESAAGLQSLVAEKESALDELRAEKHVAEAQLATCQSELSRSESALNEARESLEEALQKLETTEETVVGLREEVSEVTAGGECLAEEKRELERKQVEDSVQWEIRERGLVEGLKSAEQRAKRVSEEKEGLRQQVEDLVSMEETLKGALERKRKEGATGEARVNEVKERVGQLEAEVKMLTDKVREAEGENRALKQVREMAALDLATLTRERDAARAALDRKQSEVREQEKKAAALKEDVMKLELDNDRLEDEVTAKSKELVQRNREMMAVAAKMQKSFLEDKKRIAEDASKRLALKSEELRTAQAALAAAQSGKDDSDHKMAILIDNLRKAEREVERLGDECDAMNDLMVTVDEAFDYHAATLTQLKGMRALASRIKKELQPPAAA